MNALLAWALWCAVYGLLTACSAAEAQETSAARPNILWLSSEDHGLHLGCYGDQYATTPNVDALASKGMIYRRVWSCAPVCAPARTTLISGLYPPCTGADHMRSLVPYPAGKQMFPQLLRAGGYYCTNNAKTDYNLANPGQVWDASSKQAHWKNRRAGQPFFAVFNSEKSHESQIRKRPHVAKHDPAKVRIPPYHPDTPETRQDWAQYYDQVSAADADAGLRLKELDEAGLSDETIVFYFADHGSGMPRHKRTPANTGLNAPLVVYIPEKWKSLAADDYKPGGESNRLVNFLDFAPTVLSLAGIPAPDWMQGQAFLGKFVAKPRQYSYGFRGRMDERFDFVRSATDGRYVYVRNYLPHLVYGQHNEYMFQTPTTQVWKRLYDEGKLNEVQARYWQKKPPEELYDLQSDPDEIHDLAGDPAHQETLLRLRKAQQDFARETRDLGFLPEGERFTRSAGAAPYDMARQGETYPFDRIFATAELASRLDPQAIPQLKAALKDNDSAVRYWGAMGLLMRGQAGFDGASLELRETLGDASPYVQIAAAETLVTYGSADDLTPSLNRLIALADWSKHDLFTAASALSAIDAVGDKAAPLHAQIDRLPVEGPAPHARYGNYVPRLVAWLKTSLKPAQ